MNPDLGPPAVSPELRNLRALEKKLIVADQGSHDGVAEVRLDVFEIAVLVSLLRAATAATTTTTATP